MSIHNFLTSDQENGKKYAMVFLSREHLQAIGLLIGAGIIADVSHEDMLIDRDDHTIFFLKGSYVQKIFYKLKDFIYNSRTTSNNPKIAHLYKSATLIYNIIEQAQNDLEINHPMDSEVRAQLLPYYFRRVD